MFRTVGAICVVAFFLAQWLIGRVIVRSADGRNFRKTTHLEYMIYYGWRLAHGGLRPLHTRHIAVGDYTQLAGRPHLLCGGIVACHNLFICMCVITYSPVNAVEPRSARTGNVNQSIKIFNIQLSDCN